MITQDTHRSVGGVDTRVACDHIPWITPIVTARGIAVDY
jgi:hypothetical protein